MTWNQATAPKIPVELRGYIDLPAEATQRWHLFFLWGAWTRYLSLMDDDDFELTSEDFAEVYSTFSQLATMGVKFDPAFSTKMACLHFIA